MKNLRRKFNTIRGGSDWVSLLSKLNYAQRSKSPVPAYPICPKGGSAVFMKFLSYNPAGYTVLSSIPSLPSPSRGYLSRDSYPFARC